MSTPRLLFITLRYQDFKRTMLGPFDLVLSAMVFGLLELARGYPSVLS